MMDKRVRSLVQRGYDKDAAQRVLANLDALGINKPEQLRRLFLTRGVSKLVPRAVRRGAAPRGSGGDSPSARRRPSSSLCCSTAPPATLPSSPSTSRGGCALSPAPPLRAARRYSLRPHCSPHSPQTEELGYLQRFVESLCFTVGLNFGLSAATELLTFVSVAAAAALYGANVDVFLDAVQEAAGRRGAPRSGLGVLDAVREAANAVKVVGSLQAIRELLRELAPPGAQPRGGGGSEEANARATFLNLAALLAVASSSASKRFDASEWDLTEAEAVRIARVFAAYDQEGRAGLSRAELRRLSADLGQELTEEEAKLAMSWLDEDGSGLVELSEFVSWWAGTRRVR